MFKQNYAICRYLLGKFKHTRTCASMRACVRVYNLVVHTDMFAVTGILRNMQVFNYLLGNLKYRLLVHVQCNYAVSVHAYTYVRERAYAYINVRAWVNVQCNYSVCVHAYVCVCACVRVRNHSCTHCYVCCNWYSTQYVSI